MITRKSQIPPYLALKLIESLGLGAEPEHMIS